MILSTLLWIFIIFSFYPLVWMDDLIFLPFNNLSHLNYVVNKLTESVPASQAAHTDIRSSLTQPTFDAAKSAPEFGWN